MYDFEEYQPNWFERRIIWLVRTLRPQEGWLAVALLAVAIYCTVEAIILAKWLRDLDFLRGVGFWAFIITFIIAKQPIPRWRAGVYLLCYGVICALDQVGRLKFAFLGFGEQAGREQFVAQWGQLTDRILSWWRTVSSGGSSRETVMFALGLALFVWFAVAYLTWATFRQRQPLLALTLIGLGLAANSYFSATLTFWTVGFIATMLGLVAYMRLIALEGYWRRNRIDYSQEIRAEFLFSVLFISMFVAAASSFSPILSIRSVALAFQSSEPVLRAEAALERAFGGVNAPTRGVAGTSDGWLGGGAAGGRQAGVMPRAYLLGDAPELYETVMMTATVQGDATALTNATHWRALSYDVYTGRGWSIADSREEPVSAETVLNQPTHAQLGTLSAEVNWVNGTRRTRYALGLPIQFDHNTLTFWRGSSDFIRATGSSNQYSVQSQLNIATPNSLRTAPDNAVPAIIRDRYTTLPDDLPQRVHDLAQEVAGGQTTPYDQAVAIERFLRQYPYSLTVAPAPADRDVVDYFLFDAQQGYCDYYASAMTVLARSLGLPARIAIGYAAAPADAAGVQTIRQIDGHSWAEVYFAEYGWVEFEPTAGFALAESAETVPAITDVSQPIAPAIPERTPSPNWLLRAMLLSAAVLVIAAAFALRPREDSITARYARLTLYAERLGVPTFAGQTPAEFALLMNAGISNALGEVRFARLRSRDRLQQLRLESAQTCELFAQMVYGESSAELPPAPLLARRFDWLLLRLRLFPVPTTSDAPPDAPPHPTPPAAQSTPVA